MCQETEQERNKFALKLVVKSVALKPTLKLLNLLHMYILVSLDLILENSDVCLRYSAPPCMTDMFTHENIKSWKK